MEEICQSCHPHSGLNGHTSQTKSCKEVRSRLVLSWLNEWCRGVIVSVMAIRKKNIDSCRKLLCVIVINHYDVQACMCTCSYYFCQIYLLTFSDFPDSGVRVVTLFFHPVIVDNPPSQTTGVYPGPPPFRHRPPSLPSSPLKTAFGTIGNCRLHSH